MTYTFTYDYENHLTAVSGGSISASFVYDADGNRAKGTVNGTTTVYVAGLYEYQGGATTLYYEGNALRRTGYSTNNGVFYLLQDQLKSSSVLANQNGTVNSRNYFYPFGGNRGAAFSALTTKRFTGQYHEQGLPGAEGLSYYGARWYDAQLGRFTNADVIVPAAGNPQSLNRYSYVKNNPLGRIDPTGHYDVKPGDDPYWKNTGSSNSSSGLSSYLPSWSSLWPPFLPYPYNLPDSFSKGGITSWISRNNIPTTVASQVGFDAGVGYWGGWTGSVEAQTSFNWWSGELTLTANKAVGARAGSPQMALGAHGGITLTMGASDIRGAIVGASRFSSVDAQAEAVFKAGVSGTWARSYRYMDLNKDHKFGNNGISEPLVGPYIDPIFDRTVDSLSINGAIGASAAPPINAGISHGIGDTQLLYRWDVYGSVRSYFEPLVNLASSIWGK